MVPQPNGALEGETVPPPANSLSFGAEIGAQPTLRANPIPGLQRNHREDGPQPSAVGPFSNRFGDGHVTNVEPRRVGQHLLPGGCSDPRLASHGPPNSTDLENEERAKKTVTNTASIDDNKNCCSICLKQWTSSGKHQPCCLARGHLFGCSCIERECPISGIDRRRIAKLKAKLENERKAHERTKEQLREYQHNSLPMVTQLDIHATLELNTRAMAPNDPDQSFSARHSSRGFPTGAHANLANSFARLDTNAVPYASEVAVQPVSVSAHQTCEFDFNCNVIALNTPSAANMLQGPIEPLVPNMNVLCVDPTLGGSKALAFDESVNILYGENREMRSSCMAQQQVTRRLLLRQNALMSSRANIVGPINYIEVSRSECSPLRGCVAVASQSNRLHVLSQSLDEVLHWSVPAVPFSLCWSTTQPNLLVAGLHDGMVCAFDLRNTVVPISSKYIVASGIVGVHSLAEVNVEGFASPLILAGTPTKISAITFAGSAGSMDMLQVHRRDHSASEFCYSLAVDGGKILVSSSHRHRPVYTPAEYGRHMVYESVHAVRDTDGGGTVLEFGRVLGNEDELTGYEMSWLLEPAALLSGDQEHGEGTLVVSPDSTSAQSRKSTRAWEYRAGAWSTALVGSCESHFAPRAVKAMRLNRGQPTNIARGVVASLRDSMIQVFSVDRND